MQKLHQVALTILFLFSIVSVSSADTADKEARTLLSKLILGEKNKQESALDALDGNGSKIIETFYKVGRVGDVYKSANNDGSFTVFYKDGEFYYNLLEGNQVENPGNLEKVRLGRKAKKKLSKLADFVYIYSPIDQERIDAVYKFGGSQKPEFVELIRTNIDKQPNETLKQAFQEALEISLLKNGTHEEKMNALSYLGDIGSSLSIDFINTLKIDSETLLNETSEEAVKLEVTALVEACDESLEKIEAAEKTKELVQSVFFGVNRGSVLLLVSFGLAITFGLMGVINMAHGEFIAIGGYTTYVIQGWFAAAYGVDSAAYQWYFVAAVPAAFMVSAFFGIIMERGVIQFLYSRPLESLLATWGISMVLQQLIRLYFGAANVAVASPTWLEGNLNVGGYTMAYNRLAVVPVAITVLLITALLMKKTNWGLHIRATMQNRLMASSIGIRSSRVNMMTFAFGSGLAGLAGAFLSQFDNVGPMMGQTYIVDSFMVVVVGGVGNLIGAALSSLGIGVVGQLLEFFYGSVMGKVGILFGIILFLQVKPGGLFTSKSRSLED